MKEIIKDSFKKLIAERYLLMLLSGMILLAVFAAIFIGISIRANDIQLITHYSAYGTRHYYSSPWYYLLVFVLFELVVAVFHSIISVKLLMTKGPSLAYAFAWYGIAIEIIGWITAAAVIAAWMP